ncbi:protein-disulfide reductase DsbD domain-containing protein [Aurantiacibacter sediminis]|uniref:Thioredoxin family protein n=1 Tax=Aurantiacibacter sediminis TaxID=2793064 RepID=A0ABS0N247_9SPHN|nr:protein-disulfide reductase DsbD domain-containing protein [Aurantiacibacter sediminis]MBH5322035.1 thioredoxin family protein [Aurantiacibacter sediminis]
MQASLSFGLLLWRLVLAVLVPVLMLAGASVPAAAQVQRENQISADLKAENAPAAGETLWVALRFSPNEGWHGYWSNPGEAGLGMELDWRLPDGWQAGEPLYPVPHVLTLFNIANHAYKDDYAVLIPLEVSGDPNGNVTLDARWLACSDELCIPEQETLSLRFPQEGAALDAQFDAHRGAIPPMLDQQGSYAFTDNLVRLAIPLAEGVELAQPHAFIEIRDTIDYGAQQRFFRNGDMVVVEIQRGQLRAEPDALSGILAFDDAGNGVRFTATPGEVPTGGTPIGGSLSSSPLPLLLGGALLGGLLLNLMPCVFPILSLKALTLARAGESEGQARREGLAYTAGVLLAVLALGALMLALRAAGEQVGWAFQLQQPLVVAALLVLAVLITANLAGFFEIPSMPIRTGGRGSAFATGLLAAVVATPCTGPFMAAALGAALLLPVPQALLLFAALGFGLALPFLLLGLIPALRSRLPKPGPWMEKFRKIMAVPMGLTALALVWLAWRLGGLHFAFSALGAGVTLAVLFGSFSRAAPAMKAILLIIPAYFLIATPFRVDEAASVTEESVLEPVIFSEQALAEARASGQPVFLWFTADWCVSCKVNEGVAIEREATRAAFEEVGVIAMRGDWTRADPEITRYLEQWGVAGVPLYVWFPAGGEGEQLPQVLTPNSLVDRAEAAD